MTTNHDLFTRGLKVMPGGVNSPVRAFRSVGGTPNFIAEGQGAFVTDIEGTVFLDYVQTSGRALRMTGPAIREEAKNQSSSCERRAQMVNDSMQQKHK